MKQGTAFELLTTDLFSQLSKDSEFESVEHDVMLDGHDGKRQIDVLLSGKVGPFEVKTIIECKDQNKNINITAIDALHSKLLDVKAQKAVLVARKGFTGKALKKAKRLGISLCTAHSASKEKWKFALELPLVITEFACEKSTPSFEFTAIGNTLNFQSITNINDIPLSKIIANYWNDTEIKCNDGMNMHKFYPDIPKPQWIIVPDGRKMEIEDFFITMHLQKSYYFGYFNNLESAKYLQFHDEKKRHVIFDPKDLSDYRTTFSRFTSKGKLPSVDNAMFITVKLLHNPEAEMKIANTTLLEIAPKDNK